MIYLYKILVFAALLSLTSCGLFYDFKGISIAPEINTFYVENLDRSAADLPVDIDQRFAEYLRNLVRNDTRLVRDENEPDIAFLGSVDSYNISGVAPEKGNTTALNRLTVGITIEYVNYLNEEKNWKKNFSAFQDYDSNSDFASMEEQLTNVIIEDIMQRVFNEAFTDW